MRLAKRQNLLSQLVRIGEKISKYLYCVPAKFFVHHRIRSTYCCQACETVLAAEIPAQIIDKGIPAAGPSHHRQAR